MPPRRSTRTTANQQQPFRLPLGFRIDHTDYDLGTGFDLRPQLPNPFLGGTVVFMALDLFQPVGRGDAIDVVGHGLRNSGECLERAEGSTPGPMCTAPRRRGNGRSASVQSERRTVTDKGRQPPAPQTLEVEGENHASLYHLPHRCHRSIHVGWFARFSARRRQAFVYNTHVLSGHLPSQSENDPCR